VAFTALNRATQARSGEPGVGPEVEVVGRGTGDPGAIAPDGRGPDGQAGAGGGRAGGHLRNVDEAIGKITLADFTRGRSSSRSGW